MKELSTMYTKSVEAVMVTYKVLFSKIQLKYYVDDPVWKYLYEDSSKREKMVQEAFLPMYINYSFKNVSSSMTFIDSEGTYLGYLITNSI
jgi:hypothetical protein